MPTIKEAAEDFLANKRIAVTGVSRDPKTHGANFVYRRLRERGYEVFAVNPNATEVEGDKAYDSLTAIPGGVDARARCPERRSQPRSRPTERSRARPSATATRRATRSTAARSRSTRRPRRRWRARLPRA